MSDLVYIFKASLRSAQLPHFHAPGETTTHTPHTRCGHRQGPVDIHVLHAKAFAVPCSSCYRAAPAPEGADDPHGRPEFVPVAPDSAGARCPTGDDSATGADRGADPQPGGTADV